MKIIISSGHGEIVRGASGYLDEVDEARRVVNRVAEKLRDAGNEVQTFHDNVSTTQNENLNRIVNFHNSKQRVLDVSVHFNAYDGTASGCETLYLTQEATAAKVTDQICAAAGFTNRGPKKRTDLFFLNKTDAPAILIETCFCDSRADAELYEAHFEAICMAIASAITGKTAPPPNNNGEPVMDFPHKDSDSRIVLGELEGCPVYVIIEKGTMRVEWVAKMAVCCDGMPENTYNDPNWQAGTAYYNGGKYLDPDKVPYTVVPPLIRYCVEPVVMGCQALLINLKNGQGTPSIVGDQGPPDKIGEASCEAARRCGLSGDPNHGGTDDKIIRYVIWPGMPATVDDITYKLQPA